MYGTWQHDVDQKRTLEQQQAAILQTYIDNIQALLLKYHLLESKSTDEVAILARARTLTALQGLDPDRKGVLLQFLHEAHLIGYYDCVRCTDTNKLRNSIIDLSKARLSGAQLESADLSGAHLEFALLMRADLFEAHLESASLVGAQLDSAVLEGAFLKSAHLESAVLAGADLSGAHLESAALAGALLKSALLKSAHLRGAVAGCTQSEGSYLCTDLSGADLSGADLSSAHLDGAFLFDADLNGAHLDGAHLDGAFLFDADLSGAYNLTQQQLDQVYTCRGAILPKGLICHHNQ